MYASEDVQWLHLCLGHCMGSLRGIENRLEGRQRDWGGGAVLGQHQQRLKAAVMARMFWCSAAATSNAESGATEQTKIPALDSKETHRYNKV